MTNAVANSATGADQLSSPQLIPTSAADASLGLKSEPEPASVLAIQESGAVLSRRSLMNKMVSLPVAAAIPTSVALPHSLGANDQKLIDATAGMIAADQAFDDLYKQFGEEYEDRPEFDALEDARYRHIRTLINVRATSSAGLQAKANAMLERRCSEDDDSYHGIAASLARDVAKPRLRESVECLYQLAPSGVEDAEVIEAGSKLEALIPQYADAWLEWAKLHRQANAAVFARYGKDYKSAAWSEPSPGNSPATLMLSEEIERNGTRAASARSSVLFEEIEEIADAIRSVPIENPAALRAKTLVAIFDCWPISASSKTFSFDNSESLWSLFDALISTTGLLDLVFSVEDRLQRAAA